MALEDEMSLPYLEFRTWRNYYTELMKAYAYVVDEEYQFVRRPLNRAAKSLAESKELLFKRGMDPDDAQMQDINQTLVDNKILIVALQHKEYAFLCEYMELILEMVEFYRDYTADKL